MSYRQIEHGAAIRIDRLDGRKLLPSSRVETKTTGERSPDDIIDALLGEARNRLEALEAAPQEDEPEPVPPEDVDGVPQVFTPVDADDEEAKWLAVPAAALSPRSTRGAEIALEAARLQLKGLPDRVTVRFMIPYDESMYRLYRDLQDGAPPAVFTGYAKAGGCFFSERPHELWVSLKQDAGEVARATLHEAVHAWRFATRTGVAAGMSQAAQEAEADAVAERLFPLVLDCAQAEGGLAG